MLNEKLDYIAKGESLEEQVQLAKQVAQIDSTFAGLMRMATTEEDKLVGLPSGVPETYKPDATIPDGISDSTIRQEFRRIKNYQVNGSMSNIPTAKRELIWVQLIEGLHWKEAAVLTSIKDQTLLDVYPNMRDVLKTLGVNISVPDAPVKRKSSKKKTAKNKAS